ncbi:hypothetical protein E3N88_02443 [Mikania micrantha]|uniref:Uncharacterized protein n=1 Tax=Mikania micrantha TaxID=192012 RepID=A0A5N6Q6A0_9ASTR|nr:hypothetical protein E3N88_02443 [Mikania micrantha]
MEKAADAGEALHMTTVGNTKAPAATTTRTQSTLETEYVPRASDDSSSQRSTHTAARRPTDHRDGKSSLAYTKSLFTSILFRS